jgi:hypothetical protein
MLPPKVNRIDTKGEGSGTAGHLRSAKWLWSAWPKQWIMCQYCNYAFTDGWEKLVEYDDVYQEAMAAEAEATYGFHEDWDELSEEVY